MVFFFIVNFSVGRLVIGVVRIDVKDIILFFVCYNKLIDVRMIVKKRKGYLIYSFGGFKVC